MGNLELARNNITKAKGLYQGAFDICHTSLLLTQAGRR